MTQMIFSALWIVGGIALVILGALTLLLSLMFLYFAATWEGHGPWVWPAGFAMAALGTAALVAPVLWFLVSRSKRVPEWQQWHQQKGEEP